MTENRLKRELFLAVGTGDLAKVQSLVDRDVLLLAERDKGRGLIMAATESGNKVMADFLAMKGLDALRRGLIPKEKINWIIHDLGEAHVPQAEDDLARFLKDEDPKLRYEVIKALAFHMNSKSQRPEFERMLFEDADKDVRAVAAQGLGAILRATRDHRAARLLLKKLHDSRDDGYVRVAAYEALQTIWLPRAEARKERLRWLEWPMSELSPLALSWEEELQRRVDWAFVDSVKRQVEYVP